MLRALLLLIMLPAACWGWLALRYQLPFNELQNTFIQLMWTLLAGYALVSVGRGKWKTGLLLYLVLHAELLLWWDGIQPSHQRNWADPVARLSGAEVQGTLVSLSNVRDFRWQSRDSYLVRWQERQYELERLTSVDLIVSRKAGSKLARLGFSFGFDDGQFIAFATLPRLENGERYLVRGSLFKQYEQALLAMDERDLLGLHNSILSEDTQLFRLALPAQARRALLLAHVEEIRQLERSPRFYHSLIPGGSHLAYRMLTEMSAPLPLDPRLLAGNHLPAWLQQHGLLMQGYSLTELQQRGQVSALSATELEREDYSLYIRRGVPGWQNGF